MLATLLFCLVYFLPTVIAARRGHTFFGLLILNLLFGWTVIGWALMLLWAMTRTPRVVYVAYGPEAYPPASYPGYRY